MNHWTSAADLRGQVLRRWNKGALLAEPGDLFPLRLLLRAPSSAELSEQFDVVRSWAAALQQGQSAGYRLVMREVRHRIIGQNSLPDEAWVDTRDAALRLIGKIAEARTFDGLLAATRQQQPQLLPWLQRQPLRALALAEQWPQLLALAAWMQAHPQPDIYLRQVDVPGVHSKFIEGQRGVLGELFDLVLPVHAIDRAASGAAQFARRYGFREKPQRVRIRWLDPGAAPWAVGDDGDYTVSQASFTRMQPAVERVFITENEINFLSFPPVGNSLAVFGSGYGFQAIANTDWLGRCDLHYWGDIDTHGFAILDQLRAHHPHARSFLMDRQTLLAHSPLWTDEPQPTTRELLRLSPAERALYDDLRWQRLGKQALRLEQERIRFGLVLEACATVVSG